MIDIKWIVENEEAFNNAMKKRRATDITVDKIVRMYEAQKKLTTQIQELQSERNAIAKEIAMAKKNGKDTDNLMVKSKTVNLKIAELEEKVADKNNDELYQTLIRIPNILEDIVPYGESEAQNVEVRKWGKIPQFDFQPKQHFEIGELSGEMDFEQTAKISGARFTTLFGSLAKLERKLANFMLDVAGEYGYTEVSAPYLVKENAMFGTGQLPKFTGDSFCTREGLWLIPTVEVPLTNLGNDRIFKEEELPLRFASFAVQFRSEAGSAGKDTRGMLRQHQFKKVELVSLTTPEKSKDEHERMTSVAEEVLKRLELPYRVILKCSEDTGFTATKTYDLEVWLPGQNTYREISSCSNCGDFQARRMMGRFKSKDAGKTRYLHTLNGTGVAIGRCIIAIMENYQQKDGTFKLPKILEKY
jgi:seryl-tRNA synthetase